jgi:hypothetical protein
VVSFFSNLKSCVLTKCSDYNYERQVDGSCKLVPGLKPADHSESCRLDPDQIEYYAPTGYRRLTMSTCEGGREMDLAEAFACPGHDDEFNKKHVLDTGFGRTGPTSLVRSDLVNKVCVLSSFR